MNAGEYNEVYKARFGEYLPLFLFFGQDEKKILSKMQSAVKTGEKINTRKIIKDLSKGALI